jgi:hypothetical protein
MLALRNNAADAEDSLALTVFKSLRNSESLSFDVTSSGIAK